MNLRLEFELEKNELPINYREAVISFFKKSIESYSKELFENIYDKKNNISKSYTYSVYLPNPVFKDNILLLNNFFYIKFSTYDYKDLIIYYNAFLKQKHKKFSLNNNSIRLISLSFIKIKEPKTEEINIKMMSPLVIRDHDINSNKDNYILYNDKNFNEILNRNNGYKFYIEPIAPKKTIIKIFDLYIPANLGIYKLKSDLETLDKLTLGGIGSKRNMGFGHFKVL